MFDRNEFLKWANNAQKQNVQGVDYHNSKTHGFLKETVDVPKEEKKQMMDESWMPLRPNAKQTRGVRKNIRENIESKMQTKDADEINEGAALITKGAQVASKALQALRVPIKKAVGPGGRKTFRSVMGPRGSMRRSLAGEYALYKGVEKGNQALTGRNESNEEMAESARGLGRALKIGAVAGGGAYVINRGVQASAKVKQAKREREMNRPLEMGDWRQDAIDRQGERLVPIPGLKKALSVVPADTTGAKGAGRFGQQTQWNEEVLNERIGAILKGLGRKIGMLKPKGGLVGRRALKPGTARLGSRGRSPMPVGKRSEVVRGLRNAPTGKPLVRPRALDFKKSEIVRGIKATPAVARKVGSAIKSGAGKAYKFARTPSKYNPNVFPSAGRNVGSRLGGGGARGAEGARGARGARGAEGARGANAARESSRRARRVPGTGPEASRGAGASTASKGRGLLKYAVPAAVGYGVARATEPKREGEKEGVVKGTVKSALKGAAVVGGAYAGYKGIQAYRGMRNRGGFSGRRGVRLRR